MSRREIREREEREVLERKYRAKQEKKKVKDNKKNKSKLKSINSKKSKSQSNIFIKLIKLIIKTILIVIFIVCLLAGILIGYLGVKTAWNKKEMLKLFAKETTMMITGQTKEDIDNLKPIYCLVMGVSKDIDVQLTDTIMVCAYYPKTQQASMLSIPRDTFIGNSEYSARGNDKINSVYASNGNDPKATLKKVEKLTGLDIDNYVVIDNKALVKLVDKIGGVYFNVPINMKYDSKKQDLHINLKKGYQKIDGKKAEQLLRFRKNNNNTGYPASYGSDDYGRMRTQRDFITETIKQTLQIKNITKINDLIKIVFDHVDTNLDVNEVLNYIPAAVEFDIKNIESATLPGESTRLGPSELWFFKQYEKQTDDIIDKMFLFNEKNENNSKVSVEDLTIQVLNGTGENDEYDKIIKKLENKGYNIVETGRTNINKNTKIISRTGKSEKFSSDISKILKGADIKIGSSNDYKIDYTIVIGQDKI